MTKADSIRLLSSQGMSVKEISVELEISYQHAYSIVNQVRKTPVKSLSNSFEPVQEISSTAALETPTKSSAIRELSAQGLSVSEIANKLGIRYQHAHSVVNKASNRPKRIASPEINGLQKSNRVSTKNLLAFEILLNAGFHHSGEWVLNEEGNIRPSQTIDVNQGVYAFVKNDHVQYVGVATIGLSKRLYFYARPGATQITSRRLNRLIGSELKSGTQIKILIATPPDLEWNGLPVHGSAGLELGLIKTYLLPWNQRGTK